MSKLSNGQKAGDHQGCMWSTKAKVDVFCVVGGPSEGRVSRESRRGLEVRAAWVAKPCRTQAMPLSVFEVWASNEGAWEQSLLLFLLGVESKRQKGYQWKK